MENDVNSIDDIDALLDKEFGLDKMEEDTESSEVEETESEEEIANPEEEESEETTNVENTSDSGVEEEDEKQEDTEIVKPTKEEKKEYAFNNMRRENSDLKKNNAELGNYKKFVEDLAASYGYTDVDKFQNDLKVARITKEASEKGYDPVLYRKNIEQEQRIAQLERERDEENFRRKADSFKIAVDNAVKEYGVDEDEILDRLDKSGFTVDNLLSIPNPKLIVEGVLIDKIKTNAKQSQIEDLNRVNSLSESKNEGSRNGGKTVTIESLLKDDIAQYKKDNFY